MKKFLILVALVLALPVALLWQKGPIGVMYMLGAPDHDFDPALAVPAPDYNDRENWAALPDMRDLSDRMPDGVNADPDSGVDVFFIHPTGYLNGDGWNSPMDPDSGTEENTKWMLANQAAAYNGAGPVYAPRYREANLFYFFGPDPWPMKDALDLAYGDVARAFQHFLDQHSKGRPFVIAAHSQGSFIGTRLIRDFIDNKPLQSRFVAGYLIGAPAVNQDWKASLESVQVCQQANDTGCVLHWAAWNKEMTADARWRDANMICVNPLTWTENGGLADKSLHQGGVAPVGEFNPLFFGEDAAQNIVFDDLAAPLPRYTGAECRDGVLYVDDQSEGPFSGLEMGPGNYHGIDYPLFHMDIRRNLDQRIRAFWKQ